MRLRKLGVSVALAAISTFTIMSTSTRASVPNATLRVQGSQKPDNPNSEKSEQ